LRRKAARQNDGRILHDTPLFPPRIFTFPPDKKTESLRTMNRQTRSELFARLAAANPHPKTELEYQSPFQLLIAVLLSAQATDVGVNKATRALFAAAPNAQAMLDLGLEKVEAHVKSINYYKTKAKHIIETCALLLQKFNGQVPQTRAELESLPGVGRKTANVILNTAFGQLTMAVDTHIFRVSNRTGLAQGKTVLAVELALLKNIPKSYQLHAHHWLILHGRYVCKAQKPICNQCIIYDLCDYRAKN